jgi:hypothetical protein
MKNNSSVVTMESEKMISVESTETCGRQSCSKPLVSIINSSVYFDSNKGPGGEGIPAKPSERRATAGGEIEDIGLVCGAQKSRQSPVIDY